MDKLVPSKAGAGLILPRPKRAKERRLVVLHFLSTLDYLDGGALGLTALVIVTIIPAHQRTIKTLTHRFMESLDRRDRLIENRDKLIESEGRRTRNRLHSFSKALNHHTLSLQEHTSKLSKKKEE